jgi:hypothetical protein
MRKIFAFILVDVIFMMVLAGCTGKNHHTSELEGTTDSSETSPVDSSQKPTTPFLPKPTEELVPPPTNDASEGASDTQWNNYFDLNIEVPENVSQGDVFDVVITIRKIQGELGAVEFVLAFDSAKVQGVLTQSGSEMDAFMAEKPTYTLSVSGIELSVSRYEQICLYNSVKGIYVCKFIDLGSYPNAKPGQEFSGLIHDGDLVIKIPFRVSDTVKSGEELVFAMVDGSVMGTTYGTLVNVYGTSDTDATTIT